MVAINSPVISRSFNVFLLSCSRFFKDPLAIYCELIPQVLFMFCLFGYLVIAIFYKWIVFDASDAATAPSLLISKCALPPVIPSNSLLPD